MKDLLLKIEQAQLLKNEVSRDPLSLVLRFKRAADQEVAAFIASALAYGNVKQILFSLERVFETIAAHAQSKNPPLADILKESSGHHWKKIIPQDLKHRFNSANDIGALLTVLGEALRQAGSLENFFNKKPKISCKASGEYNRCDIKEKLESFLFRLSALDSTPFKKINNSTAKFFFPLPSQGSACKRSLLFLKWMAGTGPMTLKIWKSLSPQELIVPVDTHILKISRQLGFTKRREASWKTAEEITEALRKITPDDPTRFDFALCHIGIARENPKDLGLGQKDFSSF